ncbi:hypothetical protein [Devosia sp. SL43]|uniref:hypothetical protein n=1 Tax=Devosia sp. SL43 TaxID=2806348 RepID=UPI001F339D27|nr:hypothetical protein [Devosia sp. SL43]UJW87924.1 hypothetical protein IM737_20800 [Devosia sp. SL43]
MIITFACDKCGNTLAIDETNPPKDDDAVTCGGCGQHFGFYGLFKERLKDEAEAKARDWFNDLTKGLPRA